MKLKLLKHLDLLLLGLLVIVILVSHTVYVSKTFQFPEMDERLYLGIGTEFYRLLQHPSFNTPALMNQYLVDHPPFRPPFYPLTIMGMVFLFGIENSYKLALWLNGIYYSLSIIGIFFLGKEFLSKRASLIASFLFATFGWTLFYLHFTYSETATTTFIIWSLYFLVKSNDLQDRRNSLLFGLVSSLGILTRWVVPIFIIGPVLFSLKGIRIKKRRKGILINLLWVFVLITPSVIFHLIDLRAFDNYITSQILPGLLWNLVPEVRRSLISFQSAAYYLKVFEQLTIFIFILFLSGLFISALKYRKYIYFLLMFIFPFLIFSFGTVIKDDRYIVPIYPSVALLCAVLIDSVKKRTSYIIIIFILLVGTGTFLGGLWAIGPMNKGLQSVLIKMPIGHPRFVHFVSMVWPPTKNFSNAQEIIDFISNDARRNNLKEVHIVNLFSYHPLDNALSSINEYERINRFDFQNFLGVAPSAKIVETFLNQADYLLTKTGKITDNYFPPINYILIKQVQQTLSENPQEILSPFKKVAVISIPLDNSKVTIYRKIKDTK